jgi:S-adenosylmethionine hydrolase
MLLFLLSDFGLHDPYVGQMKAAVLRKCGSSVQLVDLTHQIPAGSVRDGAWHLMTSESCFPSGSVVLAVVDPGVGSGRRAVVLDTGEAVFVGPDNGLLGWLSRGRVHLLPEPPAGSSRTFHGRDVFAPSAGEILRDPGWIDGLEEVPPESLVRLEKGGAVRTANGLETTAAHVDGFGNVVLWMTADDMAGFRASRIRFSSGDGVKLAVAASYSQGGDEDILLLEGSQGFMELALNSGSAAKELSVSEGDMISIEGTFS